VRFPHVWISKGVSIHDVIGGGFTLVCFGAGNATDPIEKAFLACGLPLEVKIFPDDRLRAIYGRDYFLLRPDLHIAWRGNALDVDADTLAALVSGHHVGHMSRCHEVGAHA